VFILDATGSMGPVIGTVKAQAARIIEILEGQIDVLRVGAVAYRTRDDPEMPRPAYQDLTSDRAAVVAWLGLLKSKQGGEEAVADGLETAIAQMSWTPKARKVIVLIGDEAPVLTAEIERLYTLADRAKSLGIVVHTVTPSNTAWLYYFNWLRNRDAPDAVKLLEQYGSIEKLTKSFRLPVFEETAARGGGRAVGTDDTREIVKWLLAFGLGMDDDERPPDLPPPGETPLAAAPGAEPPVSPEGRTRIGWVKYGGEWRTPRSFDGLVRHLGSVVRIDLDEEPDVVTLADKDLWRYPILYLSGHGPVNLTPAESNGLRAYAEAGGTLWADNCCGKPLFDEALRRELARAFTDSPLARLPPDHPLFDIGHPIREVRLTISHRTLPYRTAKPHVEAIEVSGREAVLYSPHSLGAGWKTYDLGMPCMMHDDDALRLSENIVLYALSR